MQLTLLANSKRLFQLDKDRRVATVKLYTALPLQVLHDVARKHDSGFLHGRSVCVCISTYADMTCSLASLLAVLRADRDPQNRQPRMPQA